MKIAKTIFGIIVTIGIIIYMFAAPSIIRSNIGRSVLEPWQPKEESFSGIISVWHIVGFKAHTGSMKNWICKRADEFEKRHFGVFISVKAMTLDEYGEALSRGEKADIYSFPLGLEYKDSYMQLDKNELSSPLMHIREGFLNSGSVDNQLYAIPYMYSGYTFIANTTLLLKDRIAFDEAASSTPSITKSIKELENQGKTSLSGDTIPAALCGIESNIASYEEFKFGKTYFAITDMRNAGDIERRNTSGNGFSASTYAALPYTDLVQYIAFDAGIAQEKTPYAYEFINSFFTENAQNELCTMNAYSVIACDDISKKRDEYTGSAYNAFSMYFTPDIPNCFSYKACKDALLSDGALSLAGDTDAKVRFDKRISELLG